MTSSGSASKVLLVLPPGATVSAAANALRAAGHEVEEAANVYRAVSAFAAAPADLVVLGLSDLEDRDLEVIPVFRGIRPDAYVLALFPTDARDRAVKAIGIGADSYILEPFFLDELVGLVGRALHRARTPAVADDREMERLAGAVAHAINNPLQILELLLSGDEGPAADPDEFRQETDRVQAVVTELLDFSRRFETGTRPVDLNDLVREALPASKGRWPKVRHELHEGLPPVTGDAMRLRAAVLAIAALADRDEKRGRLLLQTAREPGGRVRLALRATDVNLPPDEADALFRPFEGPIQGVAGLAGATARAAIEAHGGEVSVRSREEEGTEVTIVLPARAGPGL